MSRRFGEGLTDLEKPILPFVLVMVIAGFVYFFLNLRFKDGTPSRGVMAGVIGLGLLLRLMMFSSTPILEDDHFRYLWDGGVLANGFNPYQYAPLTFLGQGREDIPEDLRRLAKSAEPVLQGINHPWLKTIYPPVAQSAFALAHLISPWSLVGWRGVLLMVDGWTLYLLFLLLRTFRLSLLRLAIYWWNPLLIKEIYNSGHMDVLLFPFLLGGLYLSVHRRPIAASALMGLGVGVKLWPGLLVAFVWRKTSGRPRTLLISVLVFLGVSAAMMMPFVGAPFDRDSGFKAYMSTWEMNDALYMLMLWGVKGIINTFRIEMADAQMATRFLSAAILGVLMVALWKREEKGPDDLSRKFLWVIAALFLLSPTQFPWYFVWVLPLLSIHPTSSLLLLTPLLPLYYLRFYFNAKGQVWIHDYGIVWLEFLPVWGLLLWAGFKGRRRRILPGVPR
jgi:hypothetical protein